jgi:hypothetical protein
VAGRFLPPTRIKRCLMPRVGHQTDGDSVLKWVGRGSECRTRALDDFAMRRLHGGLCLRRALRDLPMLKSVVARLSRLAQYEKFVMLQNTTGRNGDFVFG